MPSSFITTNEMQSINDHSLSEQTCRTSSPARGGGAERCVAANSSRLEADASSSFQEANRSNSGTNDLARLKAHLSIRVDGDDRCSSITWRAWKEASGGEFRVRTGDRYLGGPVWEHYLGFELYRAPVKPIKLSMIRLGSEAIPEEVVIRPGLRYAIVKVSIGTMTAHKGMWSWTAQEVATEPWLALF